MNASLLEAAAKIAVLVAACVTVYGISSWRREMLGRRRYELAEDVLALFYEAQDRISAIRSPLEWTTEGQTRKRNSTETPQQSAILDQAYVAIERYQRHQETFNKLHALRYRFMTVFGKEKRKPFDDLHHVISQITVAARNLGRLWYEQTRVGGSRAATIRQKVIQEQIGKFQGIFWEYGSPDPIAEQVEKAVGQIEATCEQTLRGRRASISAPIGLVRKCLDTIRKQLARRRRQSDCPN